MTPASPAQTDASQGYTDGFGTSPTCNDAVLSKGARRRPQMEPQRTNFRTCVYTTTFFPKDLTKSQFSAIKFHKTHSVDRYLVGKQR